MSCTLTFVILIGVNLYQGYWALLRTIHRDCNDFRELCIKEDNWKTNERDIKPATTFRVTWQEIARNPLLAKPPPLAVVVRRRRDNNTTDKKWQKPAHILAHFPALTDMLTLRKKKN